MTTIERVYKGKEQFIDDIIRLYYEYQDAVLNVYCSEWGLYNIHKDMENKLIPSPSLRLIPGYEKTWDGSLFEYRTKEDKEILIRLIHVPRLDKRDIDKKGLYYI